jgi:hypothetical protein
VVEVGDLVERIRHQQQFVAAAAAVVVAVL